MQAKGACHYLIACLGISRALSLMGCEQKVSKSSAASSASSVQQTTEAKIATVAKTSVNHAALTPDAAAQRQAHCQDVSNTMQAVTNTTKLPLLYPITLVLTSVCSKQLTLNY